MLTEICAELHNYFCDAKDIHKGEFTISGGEITSLDFLKDGQYFRIAGSALNDGVYEYPVNAELRDETFDGTIWAMKVPPAIIALSAKIEKYVASEELNAYTSESFAGYSHSKATGPNGAPLGWQQMFASELNKWRKI